MLRLIGQSLFFFHTMLNASHDMVDTSDRQGPVLIHIEFAINQNPQILFCRAALQPSVPQSIHISQITPLQVLNLAFVLLEFIQPVASIKMSL